jgi:hypothetical protein
VATTKPNLNAGHKKVIGKWQANVAAETSQLFDTLEASIKLMVAFYAVVMNELLKPSGLSREEYLTMTGGTFHGCATSKTDHVLYQSSAIYPSQTYCTRAFLANWLHTAARLAEYKATNTDPTVKEYIKWLQVMYGQSVGDHAYLSRNVQETIDQFKTVKADKADKDAGRAFKSAVLIAKTADSTPSAPTAIRSLAGDTFNLNTRKRNALIALWGTDKYEEDSDLLSLAQACMAEWLQRKAVADKAKGKAKANA